MRPFVVLALVLAAASLTSAALIRDSDGDGYKDG
jgi:hypothetical protein